MEDSINANMKANIKDSDGRDVYFGDTFWAYMMIPSSSPPTLDTVVKDGSVENIECGRNFDVENQEGKRIWNAYMVIAHDCERGDKPHRWDGGKAWFEYMNDQVSISLQAITPSTPSTQELDNIKSNIDKE